MDADTNRRNSASRPFTTRGFTLIELLVVVAIIALLISILLPSLKKARDQAKEVVCRTNMGQIVRAESAYQAEFREWMGTSPWDAGYWFIKSKSGTAWETVFGGFNRFAVNMFDYVTPLRASMYGRQAISKDRNDLISKMTQEPFSCPANKEIASKWSGSSLTGPSFINAVSYMTMTSIMLAGPNMHNDVYNNPSKYPGLYKSVSNDPALAAGHVAQSASWDVSVPPSYMPRISRLGRPQLKVFIADGLRFYEEVNNTVSITYTTATMDAKCMTCATPPSTGGPKKDSFDNGREYNQARKYSYRHGNNDRISAAFFDGHVEGLSLGRDRSPTNFTGKAVHPQYYYPSGSVIQDPTALHRDDIPVGTVLP